MAKLVPSKYIAIAVTIGLLISCDFINTENMQVNIHPGGSNQIISTGETISVDFSIAPDHSDAQRIFFLTVGTANCGGDFSWTGNRMLFQPVPALAPGICHVIRLAGTLHAADGRIFQVNQSSSFSIGGVKSPSRVLAWSIPDGGNPGLTDPLVLQFSQPMDRSSLVAGFSVLPAIAFDSSWNADSTVLTITPRMGWNNLSSYRWSVTPAFLDAAGRELLEPQAHGFLAQVDTIAPVILGVSVAHAVAGTGLVQYASLSPDLSSFANGDALMVEASEALKLDSLVNALRLSTPLKGHILEQQNGSRWQYVFVPEDSVQAGAAYTLTIGTTCVDLAGNSVAPNLAWRFTPNLAWLQISRIVVSRAAQPDVSIGLPDLPGTNTIIAPDAPTNSLTFRIEFDFGPTVQGFTTQDQVQFATMIECVHVFPSLVTVTDPALITVSFPNDRSCALTYAGFSVGLTGFPHYFRFKIPGGSAGIRTGSGRWLKEDQWFVFTTS